MYRKLFRMTPFLNSLVTICSWSYSFIELPFNLAYVSGYLRPSLSHFSHWRPRHTTSKVVQCTEPTPIRLLATREFPLSPSCVITKQRARVGPVHCPGASCMHRVRSDSLHRIGSKLWLKSLERSLSIELAWVCAERQEWYLSTNGLNAEQQGCLCLEPLLRRLLGFGVTGPSMSSSWCVWKVADVSYEVSLKLFCCFCHFNMARWQCFLLIAVCTIFLLLLISKDNHGDIQWKGYQGGGMEGERDVEKGRNRGRWRWRSCMFPKKKNASVFMKNASNFSPWLQVNSEYKFIVFMSFVMSSWTNNTTAHSSVFPGIVYHIREYSSHSPDSVLWERS